jgi:hypothetical protein
MQPAGLTRRDSHGHDPGSTWDPRLEKAKKCCRSPVNLIDATHQPD